MKIVLDDLQDSLKWNAIGACNCSTKTNKLEYHNSYCLYATLIKANHVINFYRKEYPAGVSIE